METVFATPEKVAKVRYAINRLENFLKCDIDELFEKAVDSLTIVRILHPSWTFNASKRSVAEHLIGIANAWIDDNTGVDLAHLEEPCN